MKAVVARTLVVVAVAAGVAVLAGPRPLAVAGGLLLGLALPGVALTAVLFRGRTLSAVERTVLAPALSLAVLVLSGLVIYASGFALDRLAWTSATGGATVLALLGPALAPGRWLAARRAAPGAEGAVIASAEEPIVGQRPPVWRLLRQLVPLVLVLAVLGGASWMSVRSSHRSHDITVTTLSAGAPGPVNAAGLRIVDVSVTGLIAADGPYLVRVTGTDGTETETRTVAVPANGAWTASLTMPGRQRMTVTLYRAGDIAGHRTLYIAADA